VTSGPVRIDLLTPADEEELLAFEVRNREFFARAVGDRGDDYFAEFAKRHRALVEENAAGTTAMFLVRDRDGRLVGRVNLFDIADGSADLGYRIAEDAGGRRYAREAVRLVLAAAAERGVRRVTAMTTADNLASQRVLEVSGFVRVADGEPAELAIGDRTHPTLHFESAT
jgi:ribosomal-protein-alanine N-acetyltransferase